MKGLSYSVKEYLQKAHDSAMLAIEVYNKPSVSFKSGAYITLMIIAWTALFHAIFFRDKVKPFRKKKGSARRYETREGEYVHWELKECISHYFQADTSNPIRKNIEFFIPLRNKIEHRSYPSLDPNIFGECQSLLLNFDEILEKEFGEQYCIRESLSFAIQLFPSSKSLERALENTKDGMKLSTFVKQYRSTISSDVYNSGKYSFKAFLIQVGNHQSHDALPIQFMKYTDLNSEEKEELEKFIVLTKEKQIPVVNKGKFRAGEVVSKVQYALGNVKIQRINTFTDKFNMSTHVRCWKKYNVRPKILSKKEEITTETKFCQYDEAHNDFVYTQAWVDFLIEKMQDNDEYNSLYQNKE
jgi:stalled ribosome alternative rescue factor ArfA